MKRSYRPWLPQPMPLIRNVEAVRFPAIVAEAFERLSLRRRARMLGRLLASVGPLALKVVGGGAFAKYVVHARWPQIPVSLEDAARVTGWQVHEIVRYVQQSNPQGLNQLLGLIARDNVTLTALGVSAAALSFSHLAKQRAQRQRIS